MGHYLLLTGYDDWQGMFVKQDSFLGPNRPVEDAELDGYWRQFNRILIVADPPDESGRLDTLIGQEDSSVIYDTALTTAQTEAGANPYNAFAWFNMGTHLTGHGRFEEATAAYDRAR